MRVLDVGCGVGDVSILAARLVCRHGEVTGVDIDESGLATAPRKAQELGLTQVRFVQNDIRSHRPEGPIDAIIGRHVLIHTADPLGVLQTGFSIQHPRGVAVFQEYGFSVISGVAA